MELRREEEGIWEWRDDGSMGMRLEMSYKLREYSSSGCEFGCKLN